MAKIVVAVIGPQWATLSGSSGARRLDNPDDYIVREVGAALEHSARVIPVLVGGAAMPETDALPPRLKPLGRRNAIEISDTRFGSDAERLCAAIAQVIGPMENVGRGSISSEQVARHVILEAKDKQGLLTALLWMNFALTAFMLLLFSADGPDVPITMAVMGLILGCMMVFNLMIMKRMGWARAALFALEVLIIPVMLFAPDNPLITWIALLSLAFLIALAWILFTKPVQGQFR